MKTESAAFVRAFNLAKYEAVELDVAFESGKRSLDVYVADTAEKRREGLVGLKSLDKSAMLFVYDEASLSRYHNKGVLMDLDIAWFDADGALIEMKTMSRNYLGPVACSRAFHFVLEAPLGSLGGITALDVSRTFTTKQRKKLAGSGNAMPDGSFPISNVQDLHNAIRLAGNAKDPAAAKRHIKKRAKELNATGAIPDTWK